MGVSQPGIQKSIGQRCGCHGASGPLYISIKSRSVDDLWKSKEEKCYPIHALSDRLTQPLRDNLLGFRFVTQRQRLVAMVSGVFMRKKI